MVTTHGNVVTHTGTCEACGREGVALHQARNQHPGLGRRKFVCTDEFSCFAAWLAR